MLATLSPLVSASNYCDEDLCDGTPHIACNNTGVSVVYEKKKTFWCKFDFYYFFPLLVSNFHLNVHRTLDVFHLQKNYKTYQWIFTIRIVMKWPMVELMVTKWPPKWQHLYVKAKKSLFFV